MQVGPGPVPGGNEPPLPEGMLAFTFLIGLVDGFTVLGIVMIAKPEWLV